MVGTGGGNRFWWGQVGASLFGGGMPPPEATPVSLKKIIGSSSYASTFIYTILRVRGLWTTNKEFTPFSLSSTLSSIFPLCVRLLFHLFYGPFHFASDFQFHFCLTFSFHLHVVQQDLDCPSPFGFRLWVSLLFNTFVTGPGQTWKRNHSELLREVNPNIVACKFKKRSSAPNILELTIVIFE